MTKSSLIVFLTVLSISLGINGIIKDIRLNDTKIQLQDYQQKIVELEVDYQNLSNEHSNCPA